MVLSCYRAVAVGFLGKYCIIFLALAVHKSGVCLVWLGALTADYNEP